MLHRAHNVGYTHITSTNGNSRYKNSSKARSIIGYILRKSIAYRGTLSSLYLKELDTFKGKTLKEARDFI